MTHTHSVSGLSTYNSCAAKWYLQYKSGLKVEAFDGDAMQRGSLFHAGIAEALITGDNAQALPAVRRYAEQNNVSTTLVDDVARMLDYYLPAIGINTTLTAYQHEGKPLIEHGFDVTFGTEPQVKLRGFIDAVVRHQDGRVGLLDWKVRKTFYPVEAVQMDKQLYVYAAILKLHYGIALDFAAQVQISPTIPDTPRLLSKRTGVKAEDWGRDCGRTTAQAVQGIVAGLDAGEAQAFMLRFNDKIVPETEFLSYAKIPLAQADNVLKLTLATAHRADTDTQYLPVLDAYQCKACEWRGHCKARVMATR